MPDIDLVKTELDSGIRVLTETVPRVRSIALGVWINSGARDETDGEGGLAHFLEHLTFKGTPSLNALQIAEAFDYMGADINAATGKEYTSYYTKVVARHLPRAVEVIMDMVQNPLLKPEEITSERRVVLEEIAMHLDSPDELAHEYLDRTIWGDHPLGHTVLGDPEVIRDADREIVTGFHDRSYVGSRIVVAAAGAVDHEELCELLQKETVNMECGTPTSRTDSIDSPLVGVNIIRKDTEQAHICIGSRGLAKNHPERFALAVMDNLLGGSMSSRLFQRIRENKGLAYSIYSYTGMFIGMGMVGIYCGTHPEQVQEVIDTIERELLEVLDRGFTEQELERAKSHVTGSMLISMEESGHRMGRIAKAELRGGEHLTVDDIVERIDSVTAEDLDHVYAVTWGNPGKSLAVVGPVDEDAVSLSGRI